MGIFKNLKARIESATAEPLLWRGAMSGDVESVLTAIERGASPEKADKNGFSPLSYACARGHLEVVRALLGAGARVDSPVSEIPPIVCAAQTGQPEAVQLLLQEGANPNVGTRASLGKGLDVGNSALHKAALCGHFEVARMLIEGGAEINHENAQGATPLDCAHMPAGSSYETTDGQRRTQKLLLRAGALRNRFWGILEGR